MTQRDTYTVEVAGLVRHFPLFEVAPGVRIAVFNMLGDTYVVKAGPVHEVLGTNAIGEPAASTPSISQGRILVRGATHLFCIRRT